MLLQDIVGKQMTCIVSEHLADMFGIKILELGRQGHERFLIMLIKYIIQGTLGFLQNILAVAN